MALSLFINRHWSITSNNYMMYMTDKEKQIQAMYYFELCGAPQDEHGTPQDEDVTSAFVTAAHYLIQSMFDGPKPENYEFVMELAEAHVALDAAKEKVYLAEIKLGLDVT